MTSSRSLFSGGSQSVAARRIALLALVAPLVVAACSGDPGAPIPDTSAPVATALPNELAPPPASPTAVAPGAPPVALTVKVQGTGAVRSEPAGIDCPGKCTASFEAGTRVTLTTSPAEGWKLTAWGGACTGTAACAVTLAANASVTSSLALLDARWDPSVGARDCAEAWGSAGEKLSPCDTTKDDYLAVRKSKRNVALCKSGALVKNLRSGLGNVPVGDKQKEGDGKTPEGVFFIPRFLPDSQFYKALLLSYPAVEDANRGVTTSLISTGQRSQIHNAHAACVEPPMSTALGGYIEMHGSRSDKDWTAGDIALDDASMDLIWTNVSPGDTIVVLP